MKTLKVAGACLNQTPLDWGGNQRRILAAVERARAEGVALLCLPELAVSGYGCEDAFFSGYARSRSLECLEAVIAASAGLMVCVGLPLEHENCLYNAVAFIQNGELLGFVAKQELCGDGIHYEPRWFRPWPVNRVVEYRGLGRPYPLGDLVFEVDGVRFGFEICEDAWNGVRPAQRHYLHNVDIILNPSASHFAFGKTRIREGLVVEASRAYCCTYVYSNLLGNEAGRVIYDGEILMAQSGTLLARNRRFSFQECQILSAVVDVELPRRAKMKLFSFEPELTCPIIRGGWRIPSGGSPSTPSVLTPRLNKNEEFVQAATLGMFDYMRKSYSSGFVLSLSGGADSSACAVLAAYALRRAAAELDAEAFASRLSYLTPEPGEPLSRRLLTFVYQATANSGDATRESARALAEALEATFFAWDVQPQLTQYVSMAEGSIGRPLTWADDDVLLQNIQARVRAPGVWMLANWRNALLLTTSNRSEAAVGYATMDGDTAGGLAPIAGIDKASIREWLLWAEEALQLPALRHVNNLQPTAELRPPERDQTDEGDLMPYPMLDKIEKCAIRDYKSPVEVFYTLRGAAPDAELKGYIEKFFTLWARNQWKRERYAPSFHLDDENLDPRTWCRFPILNGGYREELAALRGLEG